MVSSRSVLYLGFKLGLNGNNIGLFIISKFLSCSYRIFYESLPFILKPLIKDGFYFFSLYNGIKIPHISTILFCFTCFYAFCCCLFDYLFNGVFY